MNNSDSDPVTLKAYLQQEEDEVLVRYILKNDLQEAVYVYIIPFDLETESLRPGHAYVAYDEEATRLDISLLPPPPPRGVNFFEGAVSLARRVAGGDEYQGEIRLPLPIETWDPFPSLPPGWPLSFDDQLSESGSQAASEPESTETVLATTVRFSTGFFEESNVVERRPGPEPETFWVDGSHFRERVVDISTTAPLPVEV